MLCRNCGFGLTRHFDRDWNPLVDADGVCAHFEAAAPPPPRVIAGVRDSAPKKRTAATIEQLALFKRP